MENGVEPPITTKIPYMIITEVGKNMSHDKQCICDIHEICYRMAKSGGTLVNRLLKKVYNHLTLSDILVA